LRRRCPPQTLNPGGFGLKNRAQEDFLARIFR
jgi:hypothetical protein